MNLKKKISTKRALVIDDDPDFVALMKLYLKKMGYQSESFLSPDEIKDAILHGSYNLIIVDWMMPDLDGMTLIKTIRNTYRFLKNDIRIIMVAGIEDPLAKARAMENGADDYLSKSSPEEGAGTFFERLKKSIDNLGL